MRGSAETLGLRAAGRCGKVRPGQSARCTGLEPCSGRLLRATGTPPDRAGTGAISPEFARGASHEGKRHLKPTTPRTLIHNRPATRVALSACRAPFVNASLNGHP